MTRLHPEDTANLNRYNIWSKSFPGLHFKCMFYFTLHDPTKIPNLPLVTIMMDLRTFLCFSFSSFSKEFSHFRLIFVLCTMTLESSFLIHLNLVDVFGFPISILKSIVKSILISASYFIRSAINAR